MQAYSPKDRYWQQLQALQEALYRLQKKRSRLGWLRLAVFVLTILAAYLVFTRFGATGFIPTISGLALLLYFVSEDVANNQKIRHTKTLIRVNEAELQVTEHRFENREDGQALAPAEHAYASDLDIFGKNSIYQWLSRCYTEQGKKRLAQNLLSPLPVSDLLLRQEAVKELSRKLEWRQHWQAYAMQTTVTLATERKIQTWLAEEEEHFTAPVWKIILPLYSALTLGSALAAVLGFIPGSLFSTLFLLYLVLSLLCSRYAMKPYLHLDGIVKETATLQALIDWLEKLQADAVHIQNLQANIKTNAAPAGKELQNLNTILDRFDLRNNIAGLLFFNSFLLWDVRQMRALNAWRRRNKNLASNWFMAVAEMEVLHSISTVHFNHPDWCFPTFSSEHFTLEGKAIGHPLLTESQRVDNDFTLSGVGKIGLVTGSNMAGKSTFLRSLGVAAVMAQLGAPVCAAFFRLSPVQVVSSMRIADNLAENTSTFYAELKKLRTIIERVKAHENIFILLDEILRGTNSYDRHTGAAALLKQLIRENAVALIATHDVELAQLATTYPDAVQNYHFDVEVDGEELYFDYKLKKGICQSLNASILMKKIGIELE